MREIYDLLLEKILNKKKRNDWGDHYAEQRICYKQLRLRRNVMKLGKFITFMTYSNFITDQIHWYSR